MKSNLEPRTVSIYLLVDPRDPGTVRYVGQTVTPRTRHLQHCAESATTPKGEWIESLRQVGIMPQMIVVQTVSESESDGAEKIWIARTHSEALTNLKHNSNSDLCDLDSIALKTVSSLESTTLDAVHRALELCEGNKAKAARKLGITRQTLHNRLAKEKVAKIP